MDVPQLDSGSSLTGRSDCHPHRPTEFDLMFQEVQDRMHRLFERYAELKRRKRSKTPSPDSPIKHLAPLDTAFHSSESDSIGNHEITRGSICGDSACSCHASARIVQPCIHSQCSSPPGAEMHVQMPAETEHSPGDGCFYSSNTPSPRSEPVLINADSDEYCEICERQALPNRGQIEPSSHGACQRISSFPADLSQSRPMPNELLFDKSNHSTDLSNQKVPEFSQSSDGRPIGYQLTWKTPDKGANRYTCRSSEAQPSDKEADQEVLEVSRLSNDIRCPDDERTHPSDFDQGTSKKSIWDGLNQKDVQPGHCQPLSLQDAFCCNKSQFLRRCLERQDQIKSKHEHRMKANWVDSLPHVRRKPRTDVRLKPRARKPRGQRSWDDSDDCGDSGDSARNYRRKDSNPCVAPDNVISLKTARDETNRRLLQMQPKKKKTAACILEEAKIRRFRLVAYSRMVRNRNHYLYDRHGNIC